MLRKNSLGNIIAELPKTVRNIQSDTNRKEEIFQYLILHQSKNAGEILTIYNSALFAIAYPDNETFQQLANILLQKTDLFFKTYLSTATAKQLATFEGSGLHGSYTTARFSYGITKWLLAQFPENISYHSFEGNSELMHHILKSILFPVEFESLEENTSLLDARIRQMGGNHSSGLDILMQAIENYHPDNISRSATFDQLQIFIQIRFDGKLPARTAISLPGIPTVFQTKSLHKKADVSIVFSGKKPRSIPFPAGELSKIAKLSLLSLGKETDPITWSDLRHAELFDCGDGMQIGLFQLLPEWRLPLEAYIGYMAFKNGMPFSYGGAWCLGKTAQIGINIYETFRGGESAWMLAKLMHLYHCEYGTEKFRVEPYQLGYENEDGLQSGVFWFYYRMGFRPENPGLVKLAEKEWNKIQKDKNYHSSLKTLQELASDYMFLQIGIKQKEKNAEEINQNTLKWIEKNKSKGRQNLIDITYRFLVDHQLYSKKQWDTMPAELQRGILQSAMFLQSNPILLKKALRNPELLKKMWNEKLRGNEKLFCKIWNQLFNDL